MIITKSILLLSVSMAVADAPRTAVRPRSMSTPPRATQSAPAADPDRVAVLPFVNISAAAEDAWIGAGIAETLRADLERVGPWSIVGREVVQGSLANVDRATDTGVATEVAAGRLLDAQWIVSGAYQRLRERMRITARVVDVATATVVHTAVVDGMVSELFELQDRLAAELRRGLPSGAVVPPARAANVPRGGPAVPAVEPPTARATDDPAPPFPSEPVRAVDRGGFAAAPTTVVVVDGPPPPEAPDTISRDTAGRATVRAVRLTEPLRTDGALDEGVYETTAPISGFIQQQPDEGAPATERTEAWVFFDASNVYVSARVWDSAPESQWVANEMQRDSFQLVLNDYFSVVFDTFYDRRSGIGFLVNPLGGFMDYEITDEGFPNSDWNTLWDTRTGRFDGGWTVEIEIPFKSLRFRPGAAQIWGMQLVRSIQWKKRIELCDPDPHLGPAGRFSPVGCRHADRYRGPGGQPDIRGQAIRDRLTRH